MVNICGDWSPSNVRRLYPTIDTSQESHKKPYNLDNNIEPGTGHSLILSRFQQVNLKDFVTGERVFVYQVDLPWFSPSLGRRVSPGPYNTLLLRSDWSLQGKDVFTGRERCDW